MAGLNISTVQVLVQLVSSDPHLNLICNYITLPLRGIDRREVPFGIFRDFCQHFFLDHNCYAHFNFGVDYSFAFPISRFVVLDVSNRVVCSVMFRNQPQMVFTMEVAEQFQLRAIDDLWWLYVEMILSFELNASPCVLANFLLSCSFNFFIYSFNYTAV